jgi:hypothetical protein
MRINFFTITSLLVPQNIFSDAVREFYSMFEFCSVCSCTAHSLQINRIGQDAIERILLAVQLLANRSHLQKKHP